MKLTEFPSAYHLTTLLTQDPRLLYQALKDTVAWRTENVSVKDESGAVIFNSTIEIPEGWSSTAATIFANKYFRKRGVQSSVLLKVREDNVPEALWSSKVVETKKPTSSYDGETSAAQVFYRLVGCWAYWGYKHNYFADKNELSYFIRDSYYALANQRYAPNSPQWFNTGLNWAYGITGPAQGHWYVDEVTKEAVKSSDSYTRMQAQACFILSMEDNLVEDQGILDTWKNEARIFKFGSGSGINISNLRGAQEPLSGGGKSSGLISFAKIGDRSAAAIQSGGVTRRAAKMLVLDADHPDAEHFVNWKVDEERKVAYLAAGSALCFEHITNIIEAVSDEVFAPETPISERLNLKTNAALKKAVKAALQTTIPKEVIYRALDCLSQGAKVQVEHIGLAWEGAAYDTVSGQNSNNSMRVPNALMDAAYDLKTSSDWNLINRTDGKVCKTLHAPDFMRSIAQAAWLCADPGIQFKDTINDWHTCAESGEIRASNPCSEYLFLDNTSCNLGSHNLVRYISKDRGGIDIDLLTRDVEILTKILDISVTMAHFPTKEIAINSYNTRTLGLGYSNLGALLMLLGVPYDSKQGCEIAGAITSLITATAYKTSAKMADRLGAFPWYELNKQSVQKVLNNHAVAAGCEGLSYRGLKIEPKVLEISETNFQWVQMAAKQARINWLEVLTSENGVRNAQTTVLAPTGTISFIMDCDTTGIEPDFALTKFKKLAGGGSLILVNQAVFPALINLGYSDAIAKKAVQHIGGTKTLIPSKFKLRSQVLHFISTEKLNEISNRMQETNIYSLDQILTADVLGKDTYDKLACNGDTLTDKVGVLIGTQDPTEIQDYILEVMGFGNLEEFSLIREDHKKVFVCANICGARGKNSIPWQAHVDMMAATQPFLSGAISKTVNLPSSASINDIEEVYKMAWEKSIKCIAVYRDGSKLSQPLNTGVSAKLLEGLDDVDAPETAENMFSPETIQKVLTSGHVDVIMPTVGMPRGVRKPLPSRRKGSTQKGKIGGQSIYVHTGEYSNGSLGEIFVDMYKEGSSMQAVLNAFSRAVSIGLQYGVPLGIFIDSFVSSKFEPAGLVQEHDNIKMTTSILDYVFRDLGINYLGMDHLANIPPIRDEGEVETLPNKSQNPKDLEGSYAAPGVPVAPKKQHSGDPCPSCQEFTLVRSGTCYACSSCGSTTGCS